MISKACSIRFIKSDTNPPAFDNTLDKDVLRPGGLITVFYQTAFSTDSVTLQAKLTAGYTADLEYSEYGWKVWTKYKSLTTEISGPTYDYLETEIDFSDFNAPMLRFRLQLFDGSTLVETWYSEPVKILSDEDDSLLIEFFNNAVENDDNLFQVDYHTGIAHQLRIPGTCNEYKPAGESTVFDNQDELTKLSSEVKRILILKTDPIPAYLQEMLTVAMQHDHFYVNKVEFVAESLPEISANPSNLAPLTANLTQRNIIGLNTHDIGFDVDAISDDMVIVLQNEAASGAVSFAVPASYKIAWISGIRVSGSPVIKAGRTPGGSDILYEMSLNATDNIYEVADTPQRMNSTDAAATLYVTVSGSGAVADVRVTLIKDIPA